MFLSKTGETPPASHVFLSKMSETPPASRMFLSKTSETPPVSRMFLSKMSETPLASRMFLSKTSETPPASRLLLMILGHPAHRSHRFAKCRLNTVGDCARFILKFDEGEDITAIIRTIESIYIISPIFPKIAVLVPCA